MIHVSVDGRLHEMERDKMIVALLESLIPTLSNENDQYLNSPAKPSFPSSLNLLKRSLIACASAFAFLKLDNDITNLDLFSPASLLTTQEIAA